MQGATENFCVILILISSRQQGDGKLAQITSIKRIDRQFFLRAVPTRTSECEIDLREVFRERPLSSSDDTSLEGVRTTDNTLPGEFCDYQQIQDIDETNHTEYEDGRDSGRSEDELFDFTHDACMYERFVMEEVASDVSSDCESIESESDCESTSERCEVEHDDILYSGAPISSSSSVVLLLSFVFKHNLTREALSDLLAVVEAHCPRPNNCRTTVKKLFQFVSQAKGDIVKHYYCGYCNAYYGRDDNQAEVNRTCNICSKVIPKDGRFFIEVHIIKQLRKFFSGKCIFFFTKI